MENKDINQLWNELKKLEEKQTISNIKIKQMIQKTSNTEISKMYNFEIANLVVLILLVPMYAITLYLAPQHTPMQLSLIAGLIISLTGLLFQIRKMKLIKSIDFSKNTVATVQFTLLQLKLWLKKERLIQFFLFPPFLFTAFVAVVYLVQKQNLFEVLNAYLPRIIFALVIAIAGALYIYRDFFGKIRKVESEMEELNDLIKE